MTKEERELLILIAEATLDSLLQLATERHIRNGGERGYEDVTTLAVLERYNRIKSAVCRQKDIYDIPGG